jgi:hypothetical protein
MAQSPTTPKSLIPYTHHEILALSEPYARRGLRVDLAASDRAERRLVFAAQDHPGAGPAGSDLRATLRLENPHPQRYRLTRTLALAAGPLDGLHDSREHAAPAGLQASLQVDGDSPAGVLDAVTAVPLAAQWLAAEGCTVALDHHIVLRAGTPAGSDLAPLLTLTNATAHVAGLTLTVRVPTVTGVPADIRITAPSGDRIELPDDLLAVLGWPWSRLQRVQHGWTAVLRLKGKDEVRNGVATATRSRDAETRLRTTAEHLARTLAEPPPRFHERWAARRWGVTLRRATPLLGGAALLLGAAAVPRIDLAEDSVLRMLIFHAPPLLLVALFCMREMPRIEIPPLPRAATAKHWRDGAHAAPGEPVQDLQQS